ncbi:carbamate kinase [Lactobacillus sp. M0398]|uniref:carbamate kinase n=1 Tax=unclassified Lactobacillus TaxID=2620435 RepID=UPI0018DD3D70|nr:MULTISPECIES: carbamate kinase [unclassified Lactobacillus]MBI0120929.1 carbamate kinase [Lactobacillus sp. M0398]MBI0123076.1 carbamate kinase [Lactobacillus sp. W8174]MBI0135244.1 carbamate kinase [Lactobacillus sp. W8173]
MATSVIALGGNAILEKDPTDIGQKETVNRATRYIVEYIMAGNKVAICHGNGPQVGNLLLQQSAANSKKNPAFKLDTCGAMTEGSIGYWIQQGLDNASQELGENVKSLTVITQSEVDKNDPSFKSPSKPIGPFYTKEEVVELQRNSNDTFIEDAGRGYRKVVPSPKPVKIVEGDIIKDTVNAGIVPIVAGGGGIPVIIEENKIKGVEAVIDKDFGSEKVAEGISADNLIILTAVDNVYINFGKKDQKALSHITVSEAEIYIKQGQFAKGSMLPKIQAAILFVKNHPDRKAIITSISNLPNISENVGTIITYK